MLISFFAVCPALARSFYGRCVAILDLLKGHILAKVLFSASGQCFHNPVVKCVEVCLHSVCGLSRRAHEMHLHR